MRHNRQTRVQATIALLKANKHRRVSLPDVQRAAGAQHGARLKDIRERGYVVENITEHVNGEVHSWYVLRLEPGEPQQTLLPLAERHRDLG
jgi:hypothetical protein